jgi:hypothetical protein
MVHGRPSPALLWARLSAVAAATLIAALVLTLGAYYTNPLPAIAAVSVDVNPSLVLWVSAQGRVVSAQGLDDQAHGMIAALEPARQPIRDYLTRLLAMVGPLNDECWLVLGITPAEAGAALDASLMAKIEVARADAEALLRQRGVLVHSAAILVPTEVADAAAKAQLSPGRYALTLAASAAGVRGIDVDSARRGDLMQAIRAAGVNPGAVISQVKQGEIKQLWQKQGNKIAPKAPGGQKPPQDPVEPPPGHVKDTGAGEAKGRAQEVLERLGEKVRERFGPARGPR